MFCKLRGLVELLVIYVTAVPVVKRERGNGPCRCNLENKFLSFETITTAHVFRKIFAITDPASNILQSGQIYPFIAVRLVETAEGRLPIMRSDYTKVLAETKETVADTNSAARFSSKTFHEKEEGE